MELPVVGKSHPSGFLKRGVNTRGWDEAEDVHAELQSFDFYFNKTCCIKLCSWHNFLWNPCFWLSAFLPRTSCDSRDAKGEIELSCSVPFMWEFSSGLGFWERYRTSDSKIFAQNILRS